MPEDINGTPLSEDQNPNHGNQKDNIPDWMKEAGWGKDSGIFDESKPVFDNIDDDEDDIVPADIPAWLEEAAPDGINIDPNATPAFEEGSFITTGDLIPRIPQKEDTEPAEPVPVEKTEIKKSTSELDIPSWLKNLELDEDSQETAVAWLENMPEDLRATDEEIAASKLPKTEAPESSETETLEPPVDELAWIDEIAQQSEKEKTQDYLTQAELSEDLVASELIPEQGAEEQIFDQEEIQSMKSETPDWLHELGDDDSQPSGPQIPESIESTPMSLDPSSPQENLDGVDLMPDWLSELAADDSPPVSEISPKMEPDLTSEDKSSDLPDWLGEFESATVESEPEENSDPDWLDILANQGAAPAAGEQIPQNQEDTIEPESTEISPQPTSEFEGDVSPLDETLNTQVPDWLSKIAEAEKIKEESGEPAAESTISNLDDSASWLDQIDKPVEDGSEPDVSSTDGEVLDWLENMDEKPEEISEFNDLRDSLTGELAVEDTDQKSVELETAKYLKQEESTESMPDWLSEIAGEDADEPTSLENAIRQSDHSLSDEEKAFLNQSEETQDENADWLAKLDLADDEIIPEAEIPAIKVDLPDEDASLETIQSEVSDDLGLSGGILDRLKDPAESADPEVPQWLENLKKEEDPQETAILWLKQFVERGNKADLQDEIKRYTDELNPGDTVPKWMEDLKHEEDPQTTAMLWLEKLAGERPAPERPIPPREEPQADWLAELEKEESQEPVVSQEEPIKDFRDTSDGWLADLEIDEKLKSEETELPDWSDTETEGPEGGETPLWMKATSPLEGEFHTDELAGNPEKEVEIPAWLAGYGEGEEPTDERIPPSPGPAEEDSEPDEYAWVSEKETSPPQKPSKDPIDLNKVGISQLESILGISYQVAHGIVTHREKHGPYRELKDLLDVPEITDEQTIEILKPEVFIRPVKEKPKSKPVTKDASVEERMQLAQALLAESQIPEALEHFTYLIKKKKSIPLIIESLIQAAADNPVDISILKTLGDAYMRIDKLDEALAAYTNAEELLH